MRLALNVRRHVPADVGARGRAQPRQVAAEVVDARRRPPEADVCAYSDGFSRENRSSRFEQRLRALELFVGEVVGIGEVRDLVVRRTDRRARLVGRRLQDEVDRADVASACSSRG